MQIIGRSERLSSFGGFWTHAASYIDEQVALRRPDDALPSELHDTYGWAMALVSSSKVCSRSPRPFQLHAAVS